MKNHFYNIFLLALAACFFSGAGAAPAPEAAETKKAPARPRLPFTAAVRVGDTSYLSGWGSRDPKTGRHPDGFEAQVHQLMVNLQGLLKSRELDFSHVVHTHAYLTHRNRFDDFYRIYQGYFPGSPPALTTVGIGRLPATEVEITFIASHRPKIEPIHPDGVSPGRYYSHGIRDGDFLYTSGIDSRDLRTGRLPAGDFSAHARHCLQNLGAVLKAADMSYRDIIKVEVYLADLHQLESLNEVYRSFFPEHPPTRTIVGVTELPDGAPLLINLVAAKGGRVAIPDGVRPRSDQSPVIRVGDRIFLSGSSAPAAGDVAAQVRTAMDDLGGILRNSGLDFSHVVNGKVYLTDMEDYAVMNQAYGSYFSVLFPARSCIQVGSLPANAKVLITLTADASTRR